MIDEQVESVLRDVLFWAQQDKWGAPGPVFQKRRELLTRIQALLAEQPLPIITNGDRYRWFRDAFISDIGLVETLLRPIVTREGLDSMIDQQIMLDRGHSQPNNDTLPPPARKLPKLKIVHDAHDVKGDGIFVWTDPDAQYMPDRMLVPERCNDDWWKGRLQNCYFNDVALGSAFYNLVRADPPAHAHVLEQSGAAFVVCTGGHITIVDTKLKARLQDALIPVNSLIPAVTFLHEAVSIHEWLSKDTILKSAPSLMGAAFMNTLTQRLHLWVDWLRLTWHNTHFDPLVFDVSIDDANEQMHIFYGRQDGHPSPSIWFPHHNVQLSNCNIREFYDDPEVIALFA